MAKKIHGQPLHFERLYPQRRSARLASCSQIPFTPLPGFKMSAQEEAVTGQCQKETLILFIVCGQTAGVFGSGWNCSHLLLLFLVIFHQGHLLADTIWDAVNTMWCEIYGNDTCGDDWTCLESIVTENIFYNSTQKFASFQFQAGINTVETYRNDIVDHLIGCGWLRCELWKVTLICFYWSKLIPRYSLWLKLISPVVFGYWFMALPVDVLSCLMIINISIKKKYWHIFNTNMFLLITFQIRETSFGVSEYTHL